MLGFDAQRLLDVSHLLSAGALSFARGLNDTPKIAALLLTLSWMDQATSVGLTGFAIAAGGLLAVRRVADTMSYHITGMNDGQEFAGTFVAAALVIFASKLGLTVSTTHVCCGSLFGNGAVNHQCRWHVVGHILVAWLTTLPVAAALDGVVWVLLTYLA